MNGYRSQEYRNRLTVRRTLFFDRQRLLSCATLLGMAVGAQAQNIPKGTQFEIRTDERIDGREAGSGRIYAGQIARDVTDTGGRVVIQRGARAELIVRRLERNEVAVDLAGAGLQTLTRGKSINIPAETILTFRLDRDMVIYEDRGYQRGVRHYHRNTDR